MAPRGSVIAYEYGVDAYRKRGAEHVDDRFPAALKQDSNDHHRNQHSHFRLPFSCCIRQRMPSSDVMVMTALPGENQQGRTKPRDRSSFKAPRSKRSVSRSVQRSSISGTASSNRRNGGRGRPNSWHSSRTARIPWTQVPFRPTK